MFINVSIEIPRMFSLVMGARSRNKVGWSAKRLACWLVELQQASPRKTIRKRKRARIFSSSNRDRDASVRESASLRRFLWPLYHGLSRPCCPGTLLSIHYSLFWCHKTWCKLVKLVISFGWFFFSTNYTLWIVFQL